MKDLDHGVGMDHLSVRGVNGLVGKHTHTHGPDPRVLGNDKVVFDRPS